MAQPECIHMAHEPLSPELVLVDPELGARARAALPVPSSPPQTARPAAAPVVVAAPAPPTPDARSPYPVWARVTAALWLVVLGMMIGGAAIPHAQDRPRIVPPGEAAICEVPRAPSTQTPGSSAPGDTR